MSDHEPLADWERELLNAGDPSAPAREDGEVERLRAEVEDADAAAERHIDALIAARAEVRVLRAGIEALHPIGRGGGAETELVTVRADLFDAARALLAVPAPNAAPPTLTVESIRDAMLAVLNPQDDDYRDAITDAAPHVAAELGVTVVAAPPAYPEDGAPHALVPGTSTDDPEGYPGDPRWCDVCGRAADDPAHQPAPMTHHANPGAQVTTCCTRHVYELPTADHTTSNPGTVTCPTKEEP